MKRIVLLILLSSFCWELLAEPVGREDAVKAASVFLHAQKLREEKKAPSARDAPARTTPLAASTVWETAELKGTQGETIAYVVELAPEGYIILSADSELTPVLGYSFSGQFPFEDWRENALLHLVRWDVEARRKAIRASPDETKRVVQENCSRWEMYLSEDQSLVKDLSSAQQWPEHREGWIETQWSQSPHYNKFCPVWFSIFSLSAERSPVGCTNTAAAQILNYWKYPSTIQFSSRDRYLSHGKLCGYAGPYTTDFYIPDACGDLDFPSFDILNSHLSQINYDGDPDEEAYLCFAVGIAHQTDYGCDGSGADPSATVYRQRLGYGSATRVYKYDGVWTQENVERVISNIKSGWPVQITMRGPGTERSPATQCCQLPAGTVKKVKTGHSPIIDGYKSTEEFHLNMGWQGGGDGWYFLPKVAGTAWGEKFDYDVVRSIVYDICPHRACSQHGVSEKNSFASVYPAPLTLASNPKWKKVGTNPGDQFNGLIVGKGGLIYASSGGSVRVYSPDGSPVREIVVDESSWLGCPAQDSYGNVFVATDEHVYRIDPEAGTVRELFHDESGTGITNRLVRMGGDDGAYFSAGGRLWSCRGLFSRWSYTPPSMGPPWPSAPAIDSRSDRVFVTYSRYTDYLTGELVCLTQLGVRRYDELFYHQPEGPGERALAGPSISDDGSVVYVVWCGSLYALDSGTGSTKWRKQLSDIPGEEPAIAIGHGGATIYSVHADADKHWVRALNAHDGSERWSITVDMRANWEVVADVYAARNGVVCFTLFEFNPWFLAPVGSRGCAVKDIGDSGEVLYEFEPAEHVAIGPDTLYAQGTVWRVESRPWLPEPVRVFDHTVMQALSLPGQAGPGYTNNQPPGVPLYSSPQDGEGGLPTTVTLEWNCSDPDGHALQYDLFLSEAGSMMVPVAATTTTSYTVEGLDPGTSYVWKVIATDGEATTQGPKWAFGTKAEQPVLCVYEDFAYPSNSSGDQVKGLNGGVGWTAPWDGDETGISLAISPDISAGGPQAEPFIAQLAPGDSVWVWRPFEPVVSSGEVWLHCNFLRAGGGTGSGQWSGVTLFDSSGSEVSFIGMPYNASTIGIGNLPEGDRNTSSSVTQARRVLVRYILDSSEGQKDDIYLWVDPDPTDTLTSWDAGGEDIDDIPDIKFLSIRHGSLVESYFDNIVLSSERLLQPLRRCHPCDDDEDFIIDDWELLRAIDAWAINERRNGWPQNLEDYDWALLELVNLWSPGTEYDPNEIRYW